MSRFVASLLAVLFMLDACGGDELPEVLVVRDFELTDQHGAPFGSEQLDGHVWIASFFFTSCTSICPLLTSHVGNLHRRLADQTQLRFVSISVDPEVDTVARLLAYSERYEADSDRWFFLTGPREMVRDVVVEGFRMSMGDRDEVAGGYDIPHSGNLLLIDQRGVLRGQYETNQEGLEAIERDARRLLSGGPQ